jgi:hypothetical protein
MVTTGIRVCNACAHRPICRFVAEPAIREALRLWLGSEELAATCRFYVPKEEKEKS